LTAKESGDSVELLRAELVALRVDARAEYGVDVACAEGPHGLDRCGEHAGDDATPSRVHDADDAVGEKRDRGAVGDAYSDGQPQRRRDDSVRLTEVTSVIGDDHSAAVHLPNGRPPELVL